MSKSTSLLWAGIAVICAGLVLVGLGLRYDRNDVWQLGAVMVVGGAGAIGVKSRFGGKAAKVILAVACVAAMTGCRVYVGSKGNWSWTIGATSVKAQVLGQSIEWINDPPDREGQPTTQPSRAH
jgi:hypothetical protein